MAQLLGHREGVHRRAVIERVGASAAIRVAAHFRAEFALPPSAQFADAVQHLAGHAAEHGFDAVVEYREQERPATQPSPLQQVLLQDLLQLRPEPYLALGLRRLETTPVIGPKYYTVRLKV